MGTLSENELFEQILNGNVPIEFDNPFKCFVCHEGTLTESNANKLVCDQCGAVKEGADQLGDQERPSASAVSISVGKGKMRTYNLTNTNVDQRAASILAELDAKAKYYKGRHGEEAVPRSILIEVSRKYAEIQDRFAELNGGKFIRRGDVRDGIIAALIQDRTNQEDLGRKKEVIAELMDLKTNGFSEGYNALRTVSLQGIVSLSNNDPTEGFSSRYLDKLGILEPANLKFVCGIIEYMVAFSISPRSQLSSKIVGVIWLLIISKKLAITIEELELASDNTRKNTINQLYKSLVDNLDKFIPVYRTYGITYPIITQV